jgi:DNA-directed RNA polymerase subunit M/transcription elongation factor TFIIS
MITTYFAQDCPACSRKLHVRVAYLGRRVSCQHCQAEFVASETSSSTPSGTWRESLVHRADELLRRLELQAEFA